MSADLVGQVGEIRASISIIRKATGNVENYELLGAVNQDQLDKLIAEGALDKLAPLAQLELPFV